VAFELARVWPARADALAQQGDSANLAALDHELGELIGARAEPLATLLELHRARALAATLPAGDRLERLAAQLDVEDRRWALISRQIPVLARTAAHREQAKRILDQLAAAHPAESVRTHASLWLAEQAQSVGDLEAAANYRATVPARLLGLNASPEHPLALGKLVPNIALPDLHAPSRVHELHDRERPLLVMIWSPWCGVCKVEIPWWSLAYRRFGDRLDFLVVAMAATRDEVLTRVHEQPLVGEIAFLDEAKQNAFAQTWACPSTPQVLLLDREGRVSAGTKSLRGAEMLIVLDDWLRGSPARM
jgi:thiol-disulfide isomerase/thioredoxin